MIVRKYERDGHLFEKKADHRRRVEVEKAIEEYRKKTENDTQVVSPPEPINPLWMLPAFSNLLMALLMQLPQNSEMKGGF